MRSYTTTPVSDNVVPVLRVEAAIVEAWTLSHNRNDA